jgi:hypothetical protein
MIRAEPNVREFLQKPVRPAVLSTTLHTLLRTRPPELDRANHRGPMSSRIL